MENIRVIQTGVDISKILAQLKEYDSDWGSQKRAKGVELLDNKKFEVSADVLQLIMGVQEHKGQYIGNSESSTYAPAWEHHTEIWEWLKNNVPGVSRCAFLKLSVGGSVGTHIDEGTYYLTRDRFHLSIQGTYEYTVGNESLVIEPGTWFWFNNKLPHSSKNLGDVERIAFVFDVPNVTPNSG